MDDCNCNICLLLFRFLLLENFKTAALSFKPEGACDDCYIQFAKYMACLVFYTSTTKPKSIILEIEFLKEVKHFYVIIKNLTLICGQSHTRTDWCIFCTECYAKLNFEFSNRFSKFGICGYSVTGLLHCAMKEHWRKCEKKCFLNSLSFD